MIVYDGLKTDFLSSCENDSIAIEIEENILSKLGRHTPKAEFRSWENSLNYMYKVLNDDGIPSDAGVAIEFNIPQTSKRSNTEKVHTKLKFSPRIPGLHAGNFVVW